MTESPSPATTLQAFSDDLAQAVERAAGCVVAVHARPRLPSSGVHWRPGIIVTTDATVKREHDLHVTLPDGRTVPATLRGRDRATDLAMLQLDGAAFDTAPLGDAATLRAGHVALALARLDEHGPRVSFGVVSSVGGPWRTWKGGELDRRVQSDLVLYPGFGGGPLVNAAGHVLGINSGGLSRPFATTIPAGTVTRVVEQLLERGHVARGWIGAAMQPVRLPEATRAKLNLAREGGLVLLDVVAEGPAAAAGLLVGDVLVSVDGAPVSDPEELMRLLGPGTAGRAFAFGLVRGGERAEARVVAGERPRRGA